MEDSRLRGRGLESERSGKKVKLSERSTIDSERLLVRRRRLRSSRRVVREERWLK